MNAPERSVVFQEVASAIGAEGARRLVEEFGGSRIFIQRKFKSDHEIAKAIGREAAERLSSNFHGLQITIPMSDKRKRRVLELAARGLTREEIARRSGYHERQVYRILGKHADDRQDDLFRSGGREDLQRTLRGQ